MASVRDGPSTLDRPLRCATGFVLRLATIFVDVMDGEEVPRDPAAQAEWRKKATSARFLLSLGFIDMLYAMPGYMINLELLFLAAETDGLCYLLVFLVQRTASNFCWTLVYMYTPVVYRWWTGAEWISSMRLVQFSVQMYFVSGALALALMPVVPLLTLYTGSYKTRLNIIAMGVYYQICYLTINPIGDTAVALAKPHWMASFKGFQLTFPGCACCKGGCSLRRKAGPATLPPYQGVSRGLWIFPLYILGLVARGSWASIFRWGVAGITGVLSLAMGYAMLMDRDVLSQAIVEEEVAVRDHKKIRPLRSLQWFEYTFIVGYWLLVGFPGLAIGSLYSIIIVETENSLIILGLALLVIAFSFFTFFTRIISGAKADAQLEAGKAVRTCWNPGFFRAWFVPLLAIFALVAIGSTALTLVDGILGAYISAICYLPSGVFIGWLGMSVSTFMLKYDEDRSTDLEYWQNVAWAAAQLPLLVVNWTAVSTIGCENQEDSEKAAASTMFFIALGVTFAAVLFIGLVDRKLPESKSLWKAVDAWALEQRNKEPKDAEAATGASPVAAPARVVVGNPEEGEAEVGIVQVI